MLAVIQARMSSSRLPGKVMMPLGGVPILERVITRVAMAKGVKRVIVATSSSEEDRVIYDYCLRNGIECYQGPLDNVAERFASILIESGQNAVIRICGDSPFIDPVLIASAINHYRLGSYDLVTNVFPRTFPKGQSVEIINADTFLRIFKEKSFSKEDLEHVTRHFYLNRNDYSIYNFTNPNTAKNFSDIQLSVDKLEDFQSAEKIIHSLCGEMPGWLDIVECLKEL
jgi:spore coat polysaccharide biosynthesis protein SpsF (cytidylyltransferase family)